MPIVTHAELKQATEGMTRDQCLNEAADRAMYFWKQIDGSYSLPDCSPQATQVLELLCAATIK